VHFFSGMSDNNIDPVIQYGGGRDGVRKLSVHPFFRDNLNSGVYIVSKGLNQYPELISIQNC
jgi:hypothetical protein